MCVCVCARAGRVEQLDSGSHYSVRLGDLGHITSLLWVYKMKVCRRRVDISPLLKYLGAIMIDKKSAV